MLFDEGTFRSNGSGEIQDSVCCKTQSEVSLVSMLRFISRFPF